MSELSLEGHLHRRCGGHYALAVEEVTIRLSGMTAKVERAMFKCDKCGDKQHTVEQREAAEREAVLTMRHQHQLLTAKEIKLFRESVNLTTAQLGELLHGLPKGIVEGWEKGRYLQSPAVDAMLRSFTDREERERRAVRAGFILPPLPGELVTDPAAIAAAATEDSPALAADRMAPGGPLEEAASAPSNDHAPDPEPAPVAAGVYG